MCVRIRCVHFTVAELVCDSSDPCSRNTRCSFFFFFPASTNWSMKPQAPKSCVSIISQAYNCIDPLLSPLRIGKNEKENGERGGVGGLPSEREERKQPPWTPKQLRGATPKPFFSDSSLKTTSCNTGETRMWGKKRKDSFCLFSDKTQWRSSYGSWNKHIVRLLSQ